MPDSKEKKQKETSDDSNERVRFEVEISSDGSIVFHDVPREVIDILKSLYPDDPQTKKALDALKDMDKNNIKNEKDS